MGVVRARRDGLLFALISGEDNPLVDRLAGKLGIEDVFKGCKDKPVALREFASRRGLALGEIAFMGDDINDVEVMKLAGFTAAPADAHDSALKQARLVTRQSAGHGAVRELIDYLAGKSFEV